MYLKREIDRHLEAWASESGRKPLLLRGARLAYRTAFEYAPHEGRVFLGYEYTRKVSLPGVVIHFVATTDSLPSDYPFMEGLGVLSHARAVLENLEQDRTQGGVEKCLPVEEEEERLEAEFAAGGEAALNKLRDEARSVAAATGMEYSFARQDRMVGALLSMRPANERRRFRHGGATRRYPERALRRQTKGVDE